MEPVPGAAAPPSSDPSVEERRRHLLHRIGRSSSTPLLRCSLLSQGGCLRRPHRRLLLQEDPVPRRPPRRRSPDLTPSSSGRSLLAVVFVNRSLLAANPRSPSRAYPQAVVVDLFMMLIAAQPGSHGGLRLPSRSSSHSHRAATAAHQFAAATEPPVVISPSAMETPPAQNCIHVSPKSTSPGPRSFGYNLDLATPIRNAAIVKVIPRPVHPAHQSGLC
jgi:hypothetical protein